MLQQEVRTHTGLLVVAKGQEVTHPLLIRLQNFLQRRTIDDKVLVRVPVTNDVQRPGGGVVVQFELFLFWSERGVRRPSNRTTTGSGLRWRSRPKSCKINVSASGLEGFRSHGTSL